MQSKALASAVRKLRDARGLTRREMGAEAGVPYSFIKIVEEGIGKTVDEKRLTALLSALGVKALPEGDEAEQDEDLLWHPMYKRVELPEPFVRALKVARIGAHMTQRDLARKARVTQTFIHHMEHLKQGSTKAEHMCRILTVLNVSTTSPLGLKAQSLGLKPAPHTRRLRTKINWDEQPLGEVPDIVLAERLQVSVATVWRHRTKRNIAPVPREKWGAPKGSKPTREIPEEYGEAPRRENGTFDWDWMPLGKFSDSAIARWAKCDVSTVTKARQARNIEPAKGTKGTGVIWDEQPLGEVPDTILAERLGVTTTAVASARRSRGIAAAPQSSRRVIGAGPVMRARRKNAR